MKWALGLLLATGTAAADTTLHLELDPLPFALGGYGIQPGVRDDDILDGRLRVAIGNFSLDVPEFAAELGETDGWNLHVRPGSGALYVLYLLSPKRNTFVLGGSLRFLRVEYTHDAFPGSRLRTAELSPEGIVGYKWHPTRYGFYVIPWLGLSTTLVRSDDLIVGDRQYTPLPIQAFFTVNLGWELVL